VAAATGPVVAEGRPTPGSPASARALNGANLNLIISSATLDRLSGTAYTAPSECEIRRAA
jgi:hypothetical protein